LYAAHGLTVVPMADRIAVIERGKVLFDQAVDRAVKL
jgi:ABC-type Na+ transport system ATPase subunit NatA